MYKLKKIFNKYATRIIPVAAVALCLSSIMAVQAETLGQRAIYKVNIVVETDPTSVGLCSSFDFGDASLKCTGEIPSVSKVQDFEQTSAPALSGGDGILDGFGGVFVIETSRADALGDNTFTLNSFQMDPYQDTAGGTFKTSMTEPDAANNSIGGILTAVGGMTLDVTGRAGVAATFVDSIGIAEWNRDDATNLGTTVTTTGVYEPFTTGNSFYYEPPVLPTDPGGAIGLTLTGRAIGDANTDGILDAILVSVGNIGTPWLFFEGTPYSEIYNIQFVLVSAKPVAVADLLIGSPVLPLTITKSTDLLANDLHADPAETISFLSFTQPADGTIVDNGLTLEYSPAAVPGASDTFTYTISDIAGNTDTVTVTINLPATPPPIANDDLVNTNEDTPLTLDPTLNDTDANGDPDASIVILSFDVVSQQGGTIVAGSGNDLTYTPPQDFFGSDQFNYVIIDGVGNIANANVLVTVVSINDPLVCTDVEFSTDIDTELTIDVTADLISTCTDVENDAITLTAVQAPSDKGADVNNTGSGTIIYTPLTGFTGDDAFTYTLSDGTDAVTQTAAIQVGLNLGNFTMLKPGDGAVFGGTNDIIFEWDGTTFNSSDVDATNIPTDTTFGIMTIVSKSEQLFFGFKWFAHHIRVFEGPGTFTFDSTCTVAQYESGQTVCNGPLDTVFGQTEQFVTMTLDADQIGAHILFDYNQTDNIDVLNVYEKDGVWDRHGATGLVNKLWDGAAGEAPDPDTSWRLVSRDVNGDNFNGNPMVDGPFIGYYANFNDTPGASAPPPPPITTTISDTSLSALGLWSLITGLLTIVFMRRKVIVK